jgi:hypothetical protein
MKKLIPLFLLILAAGCVEVGGSSSGAEVCTGDTAECGDNHDESTTEITDTTED